MPPPLISHALQSRAATPATPKGRAAAALQVADLLMTGRRKKDCINAVHHFWETDMPAQCLQELLWRHGVPPDVTQLPAPPPLHASPAAATPAGTGQAGGQGAPDAEGAVLASLARRLRNLERRLRIAEEIEAKQATGWQLNADQVRRGSCQAALLGWWQPCSSEAAAEREGDRGEAGHRLVAECRSGGLQRRHACSTPGTAASAWAWSAMRLSVPALPCRDACSASHSPPLPALSLWRAGGDAGQQARPSAGSR